MTIFGIGPLELLMIVVIALVVVGPERLPEMLFQLGKGVNKAKRLVLDLRDQARAELGEDYDSLEQFGRQIRELNPRRQIEELGRSVLEDQRSLLNIDVPPPPSGTQSALLRATTETQTDIRNLAQSALDDDLLDIPISPAFEEPHDQER